MIKREDLLNGNRKKKRQQKKGSKKYRFITAYEPAFPDIKRIMKTHEHLIWQDPELKRIFPEGTKHFQVTHRKEAKNLKELLAPSKVSFTNTIEENAGSKPCDKDCSYCTDLRRTASTRFMSIKTKKTYKIRQDINCGNMQNIIYLVTCLKHGTQGVGYSTELKPRISNYRNHHRTGTNSCGITEHFLEESHQFETDFLIQPIVKLTNPPTDMWKKKERLEEFELYWQENLCTIEPHGMNKKSEVEKQRKKIGKRKRKSTVNDANAIE